MSMRKLAATSACGRRRCTGSGQQRTNCCTRWQMISWGKAVSTSAVRHRRLGVGLRTWASSYRHCRDGRRTRNGAVPGLRAGTGARPLACGVEDAVHGGLVGEGWPPRLRDHERRASKSTCGRAGHGLVRPRFEMTCRRSTEERYPNLMDAPSLREHAAEIERDSFELAMDARRACRTEHVVPHGSRAKRRRLARAQNTGSQLTVAEHRSGCTIPARLFHGARHTKRQVVRVLLAVRHAVVEGAARPARRR